MACAETEPGRVAHRNGRAVHDGDEAERTRPLTEHPAVDDLERLAEPLVFGDMQFELRLRHASGEQQQPQQLHDTEPQS